MLTRSHISILVAALLLAVGLALTVSSAEAEAAAGKPPRAAAPQKLKPHPTKVARSRRTRPRIAARASDVVATVGGQVGNYGWYQPAGCSQWYQANGTWWYYCRYDWFFGGNAAYSQWDYFYYDQSTGTARYFRTYRCEPNGVACRWV